MVIRSFSTLKQKEKNVVTCNQPNNLIYIKKKAKRRKGF